MKLNYQEEEQKEEQVKDNIDTPKEENPAIMDFTQPILQIIDDQANELDLEKENFKENLNIFQLNNQNLPEFNGKKNEEKKQTDKERILNEDDPDASNLEDIQPKF
ncbi:hypothetical protein PPERSA_09714 [Pseudocohnilembus persalinus]|uniref:Uncharacterized protein n=1 Tax=Pseudocohnilembus persalinus TaxID=266149 RepID=A0A0V0QVA4_PSEPJ|nr:hypothetical protein PPERSA_09714 [Pseudocohnilembus persalinus]|eukprot:KRX06102.1 hypothetical protein PPERSA_09714 [Pseudocohnilembus persalinus]